MVTAYANMSGNCSLFHDHESTLYSLDQLVRFSYVIKFDFNTQFCDREYSADGTIDQPLFGVNVTT